MREFEKIKEARIKIGLNQGEFAKVLGVSQKEVSVLESGGKKFLPNTYIDYLQKNGYDINTLFDDEVELKKLKNEEDLVAESTYDYKNTRKAPADEWLINEVMLYFNMNSKKDLIEFFKRVNENKSNEMMRRIDKRLDKFEAVLANLLLDVDQLKDDVKEKPSRKIP